MNQPEYILADILREVTASTSAALTASDSGTFPNPLHYERAHTVEEINETLAQWEKGGKSKDKFPLVWFIDQSVEKRGDVSYYSQVTDARLFIIQYTDKNWKTQKRDEEVYNPVILPIYREFMHQLFMNTALDFGGTVANEFAIKHRKTKRPSWREQNDQKFKEHSVLADTVDCLEISQLEVYIKHNQNCS